MLRLCQVYRARKKADDNKWNKKIVWKCVAVVMKYMRLDLELGSCLA